MKDICPQLTRQRLVIEAVVPPGNIQDVTRIQSFASDLALALGMTPVKNVAPVVWQPIEEEAGKHAGITFMMPWVESGLTVHTWDKFNFIAIEISTCKEFEILIAIVLVEKWFEPLDMVYSKGFLWHEHFPS